jgi:hypothetical protein
MNTNYTQIQQLPPQGLKDAVHAQYRAKLRWIVVSEQGNNISSKK